MNFAEMFDGIAKEPKKVFENTPLPEGDYVTEVLSVSLGETKDKLKAMFKWDLKIIEGDRRNCHIFVNRPFSKTDDSEQNQKALARALNDFKILDLPCDSKNLDKTMKNLIGKHIEINLKDDGRGPDANNRINQWQNFRRIVEPAPTEAVPEVAASMGAVTNMPDEPLPF
jgi:hypothetical protein